MTFTKRLREGIRRGEITCSVRIWTRPHVRVGARYRMEEGEIQVDSIEPIGFPDITPELARASGFLGVLDLLKVAKHGRGENIYLIRFHYVRPRAKRIGVSQKHLCGVEVWRGGLGGTYRLPALSFAGASLFPPCFRFHTPLIEPDVRICRIRLSEKTHTIAEAIACDAVCNF